MGRTGLANDPFAGRVGPIAGEELKELLQAIDLGAESEVLDRLSHAPVHDDGRRRVRDYLATRLTEDELAPGLDLYRSARWDWGLDSDTPRTAKIFLTEESSSPVPRMHIAQDDSDDDPSIRTAQCGRALLFSHETYRGDWQRGSYPACSECAEHAYGVPEAAERMSDSGWIDDRISYLHARASELLAESIDQELAGADARSYWHRIENDIYRSLALTFAEEAAEHAKEDPEACLASLYETSELSGVFRGIKEIKLPPGVRHPIELLEPHHFVADDRNFSGEKPYTSGIGALNNLSLALHQQQRDEIVEKQLAVDTANELAQIAVNARNADRAAHREAVLRAATDAR
jgi:hypothetical protein